MFCRWRTILMVMVLLGTTAPARAQEGDPYGYGDAYGDGYGYEPMPSRNGHVLRNQIDLELVGFLANSLSLRYERSLNPWISLALHPLWWWGNVGSTSFDFGVALQMRWYPQGHAMRGWYVSPQVGYLQVSGVDGFGDDATDRSVIYSVTAGYNYIIARALSLYLGIGIGYAHGTDNLQENYWNYYPLYALGPFPVFEFGVGVPF